MKSPRFALAIPAWVLFTLFFLVPVAFIAYYSFGYKPFFLTGLTIATDKLTFASYGEALSGTFLETFKGTLQISILGTFLCLVIGFPFAYWLAVRGEPEVARAAVGPGDRAVLDQLPGPHDRLAHPARP